MSATVLQHSAELINSAICRFVSQGMYVSRLRVLLVFFSTHDIVGQIGIQYTRTNNSAKSLP